jgi:hypothetical protein
MTTMITSMTENLQRFMPQAMLYRDNENNFRLALEYGIKDLCVSRIIHEKTPNGFPKVSVKDVERLMLDLAVALVDDANANGVCLHTLASQSGGER